MTITVYSKESCVQCSATYRHMDRFGVKHDVAEADNLPEDVQALGYRQAPIIVVRDEEGGIRDSWMGFNPGKIEQLAGELVTA